ncbi:adenylate/guanylate cyclase domain-containing protein [Lignipirellula cremea]|uniref:Adenylate cyclase 1 n=1 Tax=Lignipirellula cremea TaxID=2528010 RepID=A0A518DTJ6_9BACT|nr:adenylate/guanylate cyclase domain-containing protein [Lignipirellula cremea]QDU95154.1 Adenylate cyclase 1 [Lignipirellula cremea]
MKKISIRTSLMRNFLALVLGISVTILVLLLIDAQRSVRELSERLIDESSDRAEENMGRFFDSVEKLLAASRGWWEGGLIAYKSRSDLERINAIYRPLLEEHDQLSSVMLAHDGGFEYLLLSDPRGGDDYAWYNRVVWADRGPESGFEARWASDFQLVRGGPLPPELESYDPRSRPYYQTSTAGEVHWTDPYYFFVTHEAGMTAAYKWRDPVDGREKLVALDLLLNDLSQFSATRRPSPHGKIFVLHSDGSLIGLPVDPRWSSPEELRQRLQQPTAQADQRAELATAESLDLPVVNHAIKEWRRLQGEDFSHFSLYEGGETWWAGFRPVPVGNQQLWIGVVVPERDFLARASRRRNQLLGVLALALLAAVGMTIGLARRYSQPLEALADQSARVRELDLGEAVAVQSPLREVTQLAEANAQMITTLDSFSRYVPVDLVRQLLRRGEVAKIGGRDAELTILFTDIVGFTTIAETMEPSRLTEQMAEYFDVMLTELLAEQATVDKFVGDAIVAFWGAPEADPEQALHAVRAVLRCQTRLAELNAQWIARGWPAMPTCFGLNGGSAVVGNIGAPRRMNYTILGDNVNTASRLEGLNRAYGTGALATAAVVDSAGPRFAWRRIDRVTVKGKSEILEIYEPLGEHASLAPQVKARARCYEQAYAAYADRRFPQALEILEREPVQAEDPPSQWLAERCRIFQQDPPPASWDGVTRYATK